MRNLFQKRKHVHFRSLPNAQELSRQLSKIKYRERYFQVLRNTISTLLTVAAVAVLVATIWLPVLQIYGSSMTPTLEAGDVVVSVNTSQLSKGDMIAFYYNNKVLVKRVIATSGQWVDIDEKGIVSIDGKIIDEPYIQLGEKSFGQTNIKLPFQVPEGQLFVMGDYRSVSIDSRNTAVGTVSEEQLVGKLAFRLWPLDEIGILK
ncbi:TPA: signal peptidase I [Streptococcus suis]